MRAQRLEAFTDGVLAIVITITVLEMRAPASAAPQALLATLPVLLAYALSFINIGIFWVNHHHMLQAAEHVRGAALWANLSLLFWLSLVPFVIRWIDEQGVTPLPTASYGFVLLMAAISYRLTQRALIASDGGRSRLAAAIGGDRKGKLSMLLYAAGIAAAFFLPLLAVLLYVIVSALWLVPDRRIERTLADEA
jgi:uncharacterized membrane protein